MVKIDFDSKSIRGKVIAISIIAAVAIALSWFILHLAFGQVVTTIEEMSEPNDKLVLLNTLSNDVTQIGQYQRKQILKNPTKTTPVLLPEAEVLTKRLDTLRILCSDSKLQLHQIDSINRLLNQYDDLVANYLKLYADLFSNQSLTGKFKNLSDLISANSAKMDSSIITSVRNGITTTTYAPPEQLPKAKSRASLIKRFLGLFGGGDKSSKADVRPVVQKEHSIRIDTLVLSQRDSLKRAIAESVKNIDQYHRTRSVTLANGELSLIRDANNYINRIRAVLRSMETAEIAKVKANDALLVTNVQSSMTRIIIIMILFVIITSVLVYLVFTDIARSNLFRKQLLEAKEEAEYLSTVKQRFLSNMSHEIRTPLQSIIGFSEQIMQQEKPSRAAVEAIYYSSEHLLQIVNEVLDYSRIVSGKFTFDKKPFDMGRLLAEVAATMKSQAIEKKLKLEYTKEVNYPNLYLGDAFRLKQILYNLIGNAIKFTNEGGIRLEVESTVSDNMTEFAFRIVDTGMGISEEDLTRVFNEFEQVDFSGQHASSGTGLGLNIVKGLVEQQGGTLTAESTLHQGSVFTVMLSYEQTNEKETVVPTEKLGNKLNFTGKVLIIDDDPFILKLCSIILDEYGVEHTCQVSSEDLINQEWDHDISLIFTDIRMPGINGLELCKLLRTRIKKEVKIIALTAHALQEEQAAILVQGFDGLITKPFKEEDLIACLNAHSGTAKKLDLTALRAMCMQDEELLQKSLVSFVDETRQDRVLLQQLVEEPDQQPMMELCHKLAGRIGQVGDSELSFKLRQLEKTLKGSCDLIEVTRELKGVMVEIDKLIEAVILMINGQ